MSRLSVVIPAYNESVMINKVAEVLDRLFQDENIDYEIIFVDDGSVDGTWRQIENVCRSNDRITGIHFSRNFGKEAAIFAGFAQIGGDCCVVMDCDLQHPPEAVIEMYRLWKQGYEVVEGVKRSRGKEGMLHRGAARLFYRLMSKAINIDMASSSDFKLLDRKVVDAILDIGEVNTFFRALSSWVGFERTQLEFDVQERMAGETKWSTFSLIRYAVRNIAAFSAFPMQIVTVAGVFVFLIAIVCGAEAIYSHFSGNALEGFTTVILLILLIGSIIMISLGIIGYYIAKIYEEVKRRPRYIVSRVIRNNPGQAVYKKNERMQ